MPYALRNKDGLIASLHREPEPGAEFLPPDHPEVLAFFGREEHLQHFASLDAGFVRVVEDLVDALIDRNLLRITDLPVEAQQKLFERKSFRDRVKTNALNLFGDGPTAGLGSAGVVHTDIGTL
jgi:hypothetical protein